ncbi:MAG: RraA family protein [Betaproteobacteria bacterium]|nr:RraA family protein [Betaproteobacteria bacterium]
MTHQKADSHDLVARLARLDCCAVSDAMDRLGLAGVVTGLAPLSIARRIAGRVVTVRLEAKPKDAGAVPPAGPPRHLGTTAIESANRGDIIVIEQRSGVDAGSWGGILTVAARLRGVAGVIADGPVRDIDESRQHDFPVYARATTARTARGRIVETGTNVAIRIGEVAVNPGDYAIADGSAVVFVPAAQIEALLDAAEAIAAREAAMAVALGEGKRVTEVMGASYEHMLKRP